MSIRQAQVTDPVPLRQAVHDLIAESDRLDEALRVSLAWARWHSRIAWDLGYEAGRRDEARERDEAWNAIAAPISRIRPGETERRRWMLRGEERTRATFGSPHPSDYPGQGGAA